MRRGAPRQSRAAPCRGRPATRLPDIRARQRRTPGPGAPVPENARGRSRDRPRTHPEKGLVVALSPPAQATPDATAGCERDLPKPFHHGDVDRRAALLLLEVYFGKH